MAFLAKEVIAEVASHYTNGATDILSVRRMATKAGKYGAKSLATKKADDVVEKSTDVGSDVTKGTEKLYHYTDEVGAKGIEKSGVIKPDAKGRVCVTKDMVLASEANNSLFMGKEELRAHIELK